MRMNIACAAVTSQPAQTPCRKAVNSFLLGANCQAAPSQSCAKPCTDKVYEEQYLCHSQDPQFAGTATGTSAAACPVSDGAVVNAQAVPAAPGAAADGRANPAQTASDRATDPGQAGQAPAQTASRPDEAAARHASGREAPEQAAQGAAAGLSNGHGGHHAGGTGNLSVSHANGHDGSPGAGSEQAAEEGPQDAAAALAAFRAAAERRARQYGAFNAGFQRYLVERDEGAFRFGLRFRLA